MKKGKAKTDQFADLRKRAEEAVRDQPVDLSTSSGQALDELSPEEVQRLIHELRVHQVELEMQNDELRRTQRGLEASRDRYSDLYDFAPVGYFTVSEQGLILEANLTGATMLGMERGRLIKQPLSRFIFREDQDIYYLHRQQLFETQAPQVCEIRLVRKDGAQFWARVEAIVAQAGTERSRSDSEGDAPLCRATMSDITERKRAEEKLKQTVAELERSNADLQRFNRLAVGRELRMIELKRLANELSEQLGKPPPYDLSLFEIGEEGGTDDETG